MTVSSTAVRMNYTGTGLVTTYPYNFKIHAASELEVRQSDSSDENAEVLILDTDYTVSGVGLDAGGNVELTSALADGYNLAITRVSSRTQALDLVQNGAYNAEAIETQLDKIVLQIQELTDDIARAVKVSRTSGASGPTVDPDASTAAINYATLLNSLLTTLSDQSAADNGASLVGYHNDETNGAGQTIETRLKKTKYTSDWGGSLDNAIADIGSDPATLYVNSAVTITGTPTAPATLDIVVVDGGTIAIPAAKSLTINGGFSAERHVVFSITGTLTIANRNVFVLPEWFGITTSETGANNVLYFGKMLDAITSGQRIVFAPGTYEMVGNPTADVSCHLDGVGATLNFTSNTASQGVLLSASDITVEGFTISGPQYAALNATQIGLYANGALGSELHRIKIRNVTAHGWGYAGIILRFCHNFEVTGCRAYDAYYAGILGLSVAYGRIQDNTIDDIVADGVVGSNAYGIAVTKNTGSSAVYPVSRDILIQGNIVRGVLTWEGIDTHGGYRIRVLDNLVEDCREGIQLTRYDTTAGSEAGVTESIVANNVIRRLDSSAIADADVRRGIFIGGDSASGTYAENNTITGNTIERMGNGIEIQFNRNTTIVGNVITGSESKSILIQSSDSTCVGNSVRDQQGTASVAAGGSIIFAGQPSPGDSITINTAAYVYDTDITIGADVDETITNTTTFLNAVVDGRVDGITYTPDTAGDLVLLTCDTKGSHGNSMTLAASGTNLSVSGANLTGGTIGDGAICYDFLSGSVVNTGLCQGNYLNPGAGFPCVTTIDGDSSVEHMDNHCVVSGAQEYDCGNTSPQSRVPFIGRLVSVSHTHNPASIAAAGSETFYVHVPGVENDTWVSVTCNRDLQGLVVQAIADNRGYIAVTLNNPGAGAVDLASTKFYFEGSKRS